MNDKLAYWSIPKEFVIVECKDCKYFDETCCSVHKTNVHGPLFRVSEHDYCSFGERKEE